MKAAAQEAASDGSPATGMRTILSPVSVPAAALSGLSSAFPAVLLAVALALALACPGASLARETYEAPRELAGLRLGADIKDVAGRIEMSPVDIDLDRRYLSTRALKPLPGFRSGYVTSGMCGQPGRIMRIKMNYDDDSMGFYEKLLAELKKRCGEPKQWRGNPFGTLRIWKWSVKGGELGDVSIILQHYSGEDDTFTKGNSIRIAATSLLDQEYACWRDKHPEEKITKPSPPAKELDLEYFLPK